jgi:hypothetical protein
VTDLLVPRRLKRFELVLLPLAGLAFLLLAGYRIDAPRAVRRRNPVRAGRAQGAGLLRHPWRVREPPMGPLLPGVPQSALSRRAQGLAVCPRAGAVRAERREPALAAIAISLGSLELLFAALRRALGTSFAVAATVLAALDPVLVFHSRFDWAPFVLSNAFKLAMLAALLGWLREGRPRQLAWTFGFAVLGLYDKLKLPLDRRGVRRRGARRARSRSCCGTCVPRRARTSHLSWPSG